MEFLEVVEDLLGTLPVNQELLSAAKRGNCDDVQRLLRAGADLHASQWPERYTALHAAAEYGHLKVVELLIARGAQVEAPTFDGQTPLHLAVAGGHVAAAIALLAANASVHSTDTMGRTPLHAAAKTAEVATMQLLLDAGADVAALDNDDKTPLMLCSCQPQGQAVALLLEAGANLHAEDSAGYTPIMEAVQHGHTAVVEQLLAAGADPGAVVHGITLLHMAAQSGHTAVLQQLLAAMGAGQRGVVVDAVARGATALHLAAQNGHTGCVELLIAAGADASKLYGADPEAPTNLGATALHCVVQMGHLALVPLLATPANLHHLWQGQTPLHLALGVGCQPSMVQALMAAGAPLGVRNAAGATALVQAARSTDAGVRALLPAMVRRECVNYKQPQQSSHDQQQEQPVQQAMEACLVSIGVAVNVLMLAHAAAVSNSTRDVATSCIQVVKEMVGGSDTSQLVQVVLLACKLWDLEHPGWGTSKVLLVMQGLTSACCAALEPLMQQRWRVTSRLEQLVPAPQQHQQPANAAAGGNDARAADSGSHLSAQAMAAATGGDWPRFVQLWEQLMGRQPAQASRLMSQVQEQPISGKLCGKVGLCEALLEAWQAARQQVASRMQQELTAAVVSAVQAGQGHMAAARSLLRRGWRKKGARPCRG